ncbi:hypothetical protein SAMN02799643_05775 [Methylobacterium sp. UNCCL125]|jgi:hypothetical protein|nr:hypothetical protein SAMN02799643_05775 [Methylobacterium sp. UNCCL125]
MGSLVRSVARAQARARSAKAASTPTIVIGKPYEAPVIKADKGLLGGGVQSHGLPGPRSDVGPRAQRGALLPVLCDGDQPVGETRLRHVSAEAG